MSVPPASRLLPFRMQMSCAMATPGRPLALLRAAAAVARPLRQPAPHPRALTWQAGSPMRASILRTSRNNTPNSCASWRRGSLASKQPAKQPSEVKTPSPRFLFQSWMVLRRISKLLGRLFPNMRRRRQQLRGGPHCVLRLLASTLLLTAKGEPWQTHEPQLRRCKRRSCLRTQARFDRSSRSYAPCVVNW
jgi:hypothetical protein